jgi:hypothetical protein
MSCESAQASITLKSVPYGATWNGLPGCTMSTTGTALDDNLSSVTMTFTDTDGNVGLLLTSAAGDITIDDANAWSYSVDPVSPITLAVGTWSWVLKFTDAAGAIRKWLVGTLKITKG